MDKRTQYQSSPLAFMSLMVAVAWIVAGGTEASGAGPVFTRDVLVAIRHCNKETNVCDFRLKNGFLWLQLEGVGSREAVFHVKELRSSYFWITFDPHSPCVRIDPGPDGSAARMPAFISPASADVYFDKTECEASVTH